MSSIKKLANQQLKWWDSFIPVVIFFFIQLGIALIAIIIIFTLNPSLIDMSAKGAELSFEKIFQNKILGFATVLSFFFTAVAIFGYKKLRRLSKEVIGFKKPNAKILVSVILIVVLMFFIGIIYDEALKLVGLNTNAQMNMLLSIFGRDYLGLILLGMTMVILGPPLEEVIFRGYLFRYLDSVIGFKLAAFVSALVFALSHFYILGLPMFFLIGLILAYLVHKYDSLWPSIFVHVLYNFSAFLLIAWIVMGQKS